jgi:2-oxoglutarate dehydrogenase complex dehydrogenase (E1) component-like enzyme
MTRPDFEETFGVNAAYAEKVYAEYLAAPDAVPEEWRRWFETTLPAEQRAKPAARAGSAARAAPAGDAPARAGAGAPAPARGR